MKHGKNRIQFHFFITDKTVQIDKTLAMPKTN